MLLALSIYGCANGSSARPSPPVHASPRRTNLRRLLRTGLYRLSWMAKTVGEEILQPTDFGLTCEADLCRWELHREHPSDRSQPDGDCRVRSVGTRLANFAARDAAPIPRPSPFTTHIRRDNVVSVVRDGFQPQSLTSQLVTPSGEVADREAADGSESSLVRTKPPKRSP
jgi:hypothetical protein